MSPRCSHSFRFLLAMCLAVVFALAAQSGFNADAATATTRAQAIATVRAILHKSSSSCRIDRAQSVAAVRAGAVWKVTARLVMSGSGRPINETAVWNVRVADGQAVAASQLSSEIENGCPD